MMKRRLFGSSGADDRAGAIKEYREAMKGAQGTLGRLGYDFTRGSLPSATAPSYAFAGMSTEEIKRAASQLQEFRTEGIKEEIERTQAPAKAGGYSGEATHDNISAIMEATDESYRDALRDLIESQYDTIDVASELIKSGDEEAYQDWLEAIESGEDVSEADLWGDEDFEDVF